MNEVGWYCTRLAPSPTGNLHVGHGRSFWYAWQRAREKGGRIVLRQEDLDGARCKEEFVRGAEDDLKWLGLDWDIGPLFQSDRLDIYKIYFEELKKRGLVYPCYCSRKDIQEAVSAPHESGDEPIYPGTCRDQEVPDEKKKKKPCWRFRVPNGREVSFKDAHYGVQKFVAGKDFGDFVLWRQDGIPSYQLAIVVDDFLMGVTEVIRGEDLLRSTARQLLLIEALGWDAPLYRHLPLMCDESGQRMAKRHQSLSLKHLRESGQSPQTLIEQFQKESQDW